MDIWDIYAKAYDRIMPSLSYYKELLGKTSNALSGCKKILDAGTGTGIFASALTSEEREIYGIDSNESMLSYAKKKIKLGGNLNFLKRDICKTDFVEGFFDGVICINVIYSLDEPVTTLIELRRVLKKEGIFVVSGPKKNVDKGLLSRIFYGEIKNNLNLEEIRDELNAFEECNKKLLSGLKNTYSNRELEELLVGEAGFSRIIISDEAFAGQNYFIVAMN
ncbi:MAG: class I SAM-dependent methyltransferase [archaeon]